jgi:hypothetical protein
LTGNFEYNLDVKRIIMSGQNVVYLVQPAISMDVLFTGIYFLCEKNSNDDPYADRLNIRSRDVDSRNI